ncbi:MAG TPA: hypothetical protein VEY91_02580 [Candidatus Limnocylindria bacterium]|nr:hypothetical protein [Candidatus Limnocylindria bacterium]
MTLRLAAALAMVVGVVGLLGFLHLLGKGPFASFEQRHLRAMKDRLDAPARVTPVTTADFAALPHRRPVAEYSALEAHGVSMEGYVQHVVPSIDGDIHLEIVPLPPHAEGYQPYYVTAEITPQWRRGSRTWRFEPLIATFRPPRSGRTAWDGGPKRVRISGWQLYDYQYDNTPSSRFPRLTGWEIHPVTRIEIWDEPRAAYVEYAR